MSSFRLSLRATPAEARWEGAGDADESRVAVKCEVSAATQVACNFSLELTFPIEMVKQALAQGSLSPDVVVALAVGIFVGSPGPRAAVSSLIKGRRRERSDEQSPLSDGRVGDELEELVRLGAQDFGGMAQRVALHSRAERALQHGPLYARP